MFPFTTVLLILAVSLLCLYTLHKVRLIHLLLHDIKDQSLHGPDQLFRQVEALHNLQLELRLDKSLPATRGWAASPDFLLEVARNVLAAKPRKVLECGSGASTVVLARCLQLNGGGKLWSLEHDAAYAEQTRQQLARHGLSDWAEVLHAPLHDGVTGIDGWPWYQHDILSSKEAIDMLVIDGPPQAVHQLARYPAGPVLFERLRLGGKIFLDDAARPDEQQTLQRWKSEFPQFEHATRVCEKGCAVLTRCL
ncbi:class I SAM-dependent methyltransferase [Janthinobacterium agaricidamnosum]|uniref:Class I SAM-dependent methyltransferase n=1 Tax=Janthinobacterium agaricidamnosum NBRC 102515 = DSM 9628 TaxID=1349767 RepID=W0V7N2_9BURK|nr:class I SAM-dependent methyltransferase [Janthinobacterium agaricidamnosum]CDG83277.1 putative uncharacterized protein [Janthinobacterium agaricidamnosum NBRC 102515 = DSM 9628]